MAASTALVLNGRRGPDTLDKAVVFLAKRDGVDKVLKIIRYLSKLLCSTTYANSNSDLAIRLREFESSLGTSRKAYKLGKFLKDVNALRKTPKTGRYVLLELLANGGEGVYYFVEQLTWLVRAGLLDKRHAKRLTKIGSWAELIGYAGTVSLNLLRIAASLERERALRQELLRRKKMGEQEDGDRALAAEVAVLHSRLQLRALAVLQDCCDGLLALTDVRDMKGSLLGHPAFLCICGLISAGISAQKNWPE